MDKKFSVLPVVKSVVEVVSDSFVGEAVDSNVESRLSVTTVVDCIDVAGCWNSRRGICQLIIGRCHDILQVSSLY